MGLSMEEVAEHRAAIQRHMVMKHTHQEAYGKLAKDATASNTYRALAKHSDASRAHDQAMLSHQKALDANGVGLYSAWARDASGRADAASRGAHEAAKRIVYGPRGGVYEVSKTGKKHSIGGKAGLRRGGRNAANHEGGLVHHPSHECCGGLKHEAGNENCGRVKKKK